VLRQRLVCGSRISLDAAACGPWRDDGTRGLQIIPPRPSALPLPQWREGGPSPDGYGPASRGEGWAASKPIEPTTGSNRAFMAVRAPIPCFLASEEAEMRT